MTDTPLDLQAIRARCDAASLGPWMTRREQIAAEGTPVYDAAEMLIYETHFTASDAAFIAHARTDIPALLDALAARDAEIEQMKDVIESYRSAAEDARFERDTRG